MKRSTLLVALFFCLTACASGPELLKRPSLPYDTWYVGLAAPKHMEVWVESVDVIDRRGYFYSHVFGGVASYTGKVKGWHKGGGATMPINNVDLPDQIFLRWQSLAEPQTYHVSIEVPQWVRDEMLTPEENLCVLDEQVETYYRNRITLGMAPGGIVKMWVGVACLGYKEVGRFQAEADPRGPYKGKSKGKYVPIEPENKAYIEKHGIPYGTW